MCFKQEDAACTLIAGLGPDLCLSALSACLCDALQIQALRNANRPLQASCHLSQISI